MNTIYGLKAMMDTGQENQKGGSQAIRFADCLGVLPLAELRPTNASAVLELAAKAAFLAPQKAQVW